MKLRYNPNTLPFTKMRTLARTLLVPAKAKSMEGGEVVPGVERVLSGHSSAYLVSINDDATEYVLIDTGMETDAGNIHATLRARGLDALAVKAIFITHGHIDHASGAGTFPDTPVYVGQGDKAYMLGQRTGESIVGAIAGKLSSDTRPAEAQLRIINDGDRMSVGNKVVQVIGVPGHTSGSMAYVINDVVFIGDAAYFQTNGQANLPPAPLTADGKLAVRSLNSLVKIINESHPQVTIVIPGHSGQGTIEALTAFASSKNQQ